MPLRLASRPARQRVAVPRSDWRLDGTRQLPSGVVQLRYLATSTIKPGS